MSLDLRITDLPSTLHLFPVDAFVLLPEASLPLTITSSWRRRILDAAEEVGGWIGVIQGQPEESFSREYEVGCLGHIITLGRTDSGHHLVLEGLVRFRVRADLPREDGLPRALVSYEEFARDLECIEEELPGWNLEGFKDQIVRFGRSQFGTAGILEDMKPRDVVRFMAQTSPFEPAERQALLEARGFPEMLDILMQLLGVNLTTTPDTSPHAN